MDRVFLDEAVFRAKRASLPLLLPWEQGWLWRALGHTPIEWFELSAHPTLIDRVLPSAAKKPRIMGRFLPQPFVQSDSVASLLT
eukprot:2515448-Amphidinium_carterae.1